MNIGYWIVCIPHLSVLNYLFFRSSEIWLKLTVWWKWKMNPTKFENWTFAWLNYQWGDAPCTFTWLLRSTPGNECDIRFWRLSDRRLYQANGYSFHCLPDHLLTFGLPPPLFIPPYFLTVLDMRRPRDIREMIRHFCGSFYMAANRSRKLRRGVWPVVRRRSGDLRPGNHFVCLALLLHKQGW